MSNQLPQNLGTIFEIYRSATGLCVFGLYNDLVYDVQSNVIDLWLLSQAYTLYIIKILSISFCS